MNQNKQKTGHKEYQHWSVKPKKDRAGGDGGRAVRALWDPIGFPR